MRIATSLILSIAFCSFAHAAFAHATLSRSSPADGERLAAPTAFTLQFSEGLEPAFSHMTVSTSSGGPVGLTDEHVSGDGDNVLCASPSTPLPPGNYTIRWDVLSKDGHKTGGTRSFRVTP
jgi:methionine-rich copper-binding protein CopC